MLPLREVHYQPPNPRPRRYPYSLGALHGFKSLIFTTPVTFLIGDNGSGKSTFLEALAVSAGFHAEGGSKHANYAATSTDTELAQSLHLVWNRKAVNGFFFRAETLFSYATYLDEMNKEPFSGDVLGSYGGISLHQRSHGEVLSGTLSKSAGEPAAFPVSIRRAGIGPLHHRPAGFSQAHARMGAVGSCASHRGHPFAHTSGVPPIKHLDI